MKKLIVLLFALCLYIGVFAQQLNYQAIIRDDNQQLVTNTSVTANIVVKVSGSAVFQQTVNGTTNLHGLFDIPFGDATLGSIDWPHATISVEVKSTSTGVIYMPAEDRPVNAVPYALNAANAPSSAQVNADWNATEGAAHILNKPTNVSQLNNDAGYVSNNNCPTVDLCDLYNLITSMQSTIAHQDSIINALNNQIDSLFVCGSSTVKDHQGNAYNTVQIGNKCWTRENMRCTTSPSTGTYIVKSPADTNSCSGKMAYYYKDSVMSANSYGLLYNWYAAVDTFNVELGETSISTDSRDALDITFSGRRRGICPQGWHVPSDAEWTTLTDYVSDQFEYQCNSNTTIAKSLASTTGWYTSSLTCVVGNDLSSNNATGFTAVPVGDYTFNFDSFGGSACFWSATQKNKQNAYFRMLSYLGSDVHRSETGNYKMYGYSVRCVRD